MVRAYVYVKISEYPLGRGPTNVDDAPAPEHKSKPDEDEVI